MAFAISSLDAALWIGNLEKMFSILAELISFKAAEREI